MNSKENAKKKQGTLLLLSIVTKCGTYKENCASFDGKR
jgi:hypothetical protein